MKPLSTLAREIKPSATLAMDNLFKEMRARGEDVLGFAAGEPDFPTPEHIRAAGIAAIQNGDTRYTPPAGTLELREAVAARLRESFGLAYRPEQIAASNGAKTCVYVSLRALVDPGDEVIVPAPCWVSYVEQVRMVGGAPVVLETGWEEGFKLTPQRLAAAITPKTKCLILNNPCNPTGVVYSREELAALARVCVERDIYVISDEVYCDLVYDGAEFTSFAALGEEAQERTLLVNGVSKSYAMTGWRLGYVAAPAEVARVITKYLGHCTGNPCTISQKAAAAALAGPREPVEETRRAFQRRRDYMVERMGRMPGIRCTRPQGAFYVMMDVKGLYGKERFGSVIRSDEDFCRLFLQHGKVAVVPGTGFGAPGLVRWSYSASMERIREGLDRLEQFLLHA